MIVKGTLFDLGPLSTGIGTYSSKWDGPVTLTFDSQRHMLSLSTSNLSKPQYQVKELPQSRKDNPTKKLQAYCLNYPPHLFQ
jgi:hypothetical protein